MTRYTKADTAGDLEEILVLQQANVIQRLTKYEIESQGFVTVTHSYEQLQKLNGTEKHVIAKDGDRLIGYLLAMTQQASHDIPVLIPMFDAFSKVSYRDKVITDYNFLVVGQVCIAKEYRGKGIL
ncbi:MAG: GNAT family N-acetyltransferase, partial [Gloeobacteraceae cyanobacterium ES-bin-316]|nr:GNAT family N-acetyltransferase [Ferruginibacter sp.]